MSFELGTGRLAVGLRPQETHVPLGSFAYVRMNRAFYAKFATEKST
nr:MAG TPA: hypothetical protein [Caudoviricetes sp.]